jgi:hypothetical protein
MRGIERAFTAFLLAGAVAGAALIPRFLAGHAVSPQVQLTPNSPSPSTVIHAASAPRRHATPPRPGVLPLGPRLALPAPTPLIGLTQPALAQKPVSPGEPVSVTPAPGPTPTRPVEPTQPSEPAPLSQPAPPPAAPPAQAAAPPAPAKPKVPPKQSSAGRGDGSKSEQTTPLRPTKRTAGSPPQALAEPIETTLPPEHAPGPVVQPPPTMPGSQPQSGPLDTSVVAAPTLSISPTPTESVETQLAGGLPTVSSDS